MLDITSYLAGFSAHPPADGNDTEAPQFIGVSETGIAVPGASVLPGVAAPATDASLLNPLAGVKSAGVTAVQYLAIALVGVVLLGIGAVVLTGANPVRAVERATP